MSDRTAPPSTFEPSPRTALDVLDDLVGRLLDAREDQCAQSRRLIAEMPSSDSDRWQAWFLAVSEGHARYDGLYAASEIVDAMRKELGR